MGYSHSLVVNPNGRHYSELQSKLATSYEDVVWGEDAVFMERNSRDFARRVHVINNNTEALCDMLYSVSEEQHHEVNDQANGSDKKDERPFIIKSVFFPKFITRTNYDTYRIKTPSSPTSYPGGYGGLFSLSFTSTLASRTFFDSLPCAKGPSLGTNFTLACPFTILMHFNELEWAESYGVHRSLVRVSVGMEGEEVLKGWFAEALREAERVVREAVEAGKSLD
jgi:cystathionine gamma-synthase